MKKIVGFLCLAFILSLPLQSQPNYKKVWTKKEVKHWYKHKEWLNGFTVKPNKTINSVEFAKQYHANKSYWDKAFLFLKNNDLKNISKGKYTIDGDNVYALVTQNPSKDFDSTQWESHKKYIDIQYVIEGKEMIGMHPAANSTVIKKFDAAKDVINYITEGKLYVATPSTFFIFFPADAHRPNITLGGNKVVKKVVIKVKVAE